MATTLDQELLATLNELITLDKASAAAFEAASEQLRDPEVIRVLQGFRQDHERHARDLTRLVRDRGGQIQERREILEQFAHPARQLRTLDDPQLLLIALRENEELTNELYEDAATSGVVGGDHPDVQALIDRHYADEKAHLRSLQQQIATREGAARPRSSQRDQDQRATRDLNEARLEELAAIEGIGDARARAVADARPFASWDDVRAVHGMDELLFQHLRSTFALARS